MDTARQSPRQASHEARGRPGGAAVSRESSHRREAEPERQPQPEASRRAEAKSRWSWVKLSTGEQPRKPVSPESARDGQCRGLSAAPQLAVTPCPTVTALAAAHLGVVGPQGLRHRAHLMRGPESGSVLPSRVRSRSGDESQEWPLPAHQPSRQPEGPQPLETPVSACGLRAAA